MKKGEKRRILFVSVLIVAPLVFSIEAQALTLFNQSVDASITGSYSNIGGQVTADDFSLSTNAYISGITWYGYFDSNPSSIGSIDFDIAIYDDDSNKPNFNSSFLELNSATVTDTSFDAVNGNNIYKFEALLSSSFLALSSNNYWLSIADNDSATSQFLWSRNNMSGTYAYRNTFGGIITDWSTSPHGDFAFELTPVPEPATMLLFGTGIAGLAGSRLRRKKK
jgi:hypothetical protein